MNAELAIIIPAYRGKFLSQTLKSLADQTCHDFKVYVGDDASADDLKLIVDQFSDILNIEYHRFDDNLGHLNLCLQWERCVNLSSEPWIWLFSDDDIMDSQCVEAFYKAPARAQAELFHFNVNIIDSDGYLLEQSFFPDAITPQRFAKLRFTGRIRSYAVEYVFKREALKRIGGFVEFDLCWNSDDATWISLATRQNTIRTIQGPRVSWRRSGINITTLNDSLTTIRKLDADIEYIKWTNRQFGYVMGRLFWFVTKLFHVSSVLTEKQIKEYLRKAAESSSNASIYYLVALIMYKIKELRNHK